MLLGKSRCISWHNSCSLIPYGYEQVDSYCFVYVSAVSRRAGGPGAIGRRRRPGCGANGASAGDRVQRRDETRAKIHRIASWATLPLAGTEAILGENVFNDPQGQSSYRGAHIAVGTAITGLFVAQTATGLWNLVDSWKDPNHKTLRRLHSIMMLGADAGFVAVYGTAPGGHNLVNFDQQKSTHRTVVFTSMGVATASYLLMLFGNK